MTKKGQVFDQISSLGVGIAALAIVLIVVFLILSNLGSNDQVTTGSFAENATNTLTDSAADIPGWIPLIVIAIIGSILLGLVALFRR